MRKKYEFVLSFKQQGAAVWTKTSAGMAAFNKEVKAGNGLLGGLHNKIGLVTGSMLGFAGVIGTGLGLSRMIADVVEGEKQIENFARTAGQSVGQFQAYSWAVQSVGLESDKLADISADVMRKLGDFSENGSGPFADFFENVGKKVGLTADQVARLSGPEALIALKKAMDDANVSMENQKFYLDDIASDADHLIPLLEDEGKAWKELAAQAEKMGVAISDLDHAQLMELNKILKEVRTNLGITRREIVIALAPAIRDMAKYFSENTDELKEFVIGLAEGTAEVLKFVLTHHELIITVGKAIIAIGLLSSGISAATTIMRGMNAATLAMTGMRVVPWLTTFATGLKGVQIASLGAAAGIGAAAGATLAFVGGYAIGKKIDEWEYFSSVVGANKEALEEVPEKFKAITKATGVTIKSFDDLNAAQKKGLIVFDDVKGEWVKGAGEMAEAVSDSADEQSRITGVKLKEMEAAYKKYADEVKKLQDQIAGRERDLAEELRELSRSGMSDLSAWKDRKKEAEEYYVAAEKAAKAGDYETAIELADKAKAAYADLNTEVESNGKVAITSSEGLKTAMTGVEKAGKLAIGILEDQKEAAAQAADALNDESGYQLADKQLSGLTDQTQLYIDKVKASAQQWELSFNKMEKDGSSAVDELERKFNLLEKDRHVKVYIEEVVKKATGGLAGGPFGFAGGGTPMYFSRPTSPLITRGTSKKDDVPAMLSWWEFIQPEDSVKFYGLDFMERVRRRLYPRELARGFAQGGTPAGTVSLPPTTGGSSITINANFSGDVTPMGRHTARQNARMLVDEVKRAMRRSS